MGTGHNKEKDPDLPELGKFSQFSIVVTPEGMFASLSSYLPHLLSQENSTTPAATSRVNQRKRPLDE